MGAVPLVSAVTVLSLTKPKRLPGFVVRKQVKDHGTKKTIETGEDLNGKNVVVLDDVTTTGESAMHAVEAAQQAGANIILVLSIVDREEGAAEFYKAAEGQPSVRLTLVDATVPNPKEQELTLP